MLRVWNEANRCSIERPKMRTSMEKKLASIWHAVMPHILVSRWTCGIKMYMDLNDNLYALFAIRDISQYEKPQADELLPHRSPLWDIGASIGTETLLAARRGAFVVALDASARACNTLNKSVLANDFQSRVVVINDAFTATLTAYLPPANGSGDARIGFGGYCGVRRIGTNWETLSNLYGVPKMVKMDIEGGELEFFRSEAWRNWLKENNVTWLVEVHRWIEDMIPWKSWDREMPRRQLSWKHWIINES